MFKKSNCHTILLCATLSVAILSFVVLLSLVAIIEKKHHTSNIPAPTIKKDLRVEYVSCPTIEEWAEITNYWRQCQWKPKDTSGDSETQMFDDLFITVLSLTNLIDSFLLFCSSLVKFPYALARIVIFVIFNARFVWRLWTWPWD